MICFWYACSVIWSSEIIARQGIVVIVDAQSNNARFSRQYARIIYDLFDGDQLLIYLVKSDGFWEKHVDHHCTKTLYNHSRSKVSNYNNNGDEVSKQTSHIHIYPIYISFRFMLHNYIMQHVQII